VRDRPMFKRHKARRVIDRTLEIMITSSLIVTSFLGVSALGCWGLEIIETNTNSTIIGQTHWQAKKNICLGAMVVGLSAFLGSGILAAILSDDE
jgi:hypothetical protein